MKASAGGELLIYVLRNHAESIAVRKANPTLPCFSLHKPETKPNDVRSLRYSNFCCSHRRMIETVLPPLSPEYEALFNATPTPLLVVAPPNWFMVAANDARLSATATTREETIGRKLFDVFPDDASDPSADGVQKLTASFERVVTTRTADTMEVQRYSLRGADGKFVQRWWVPVNSPVFGPDSEVQFIIHSVGEVTDIVRMDLLLQSLPGMAYRCQVEEPWLMQYVSPGVASVCSFSPKDFTEHRVQWGALIHTDDLAAIDVELADAIAKQRQFNFHYRIIDPLLGNRWVNEVGQAIYNTDGKAEALVGFIIDATDHEQTHEQLRQAEQRYELAAKATGEIIWDRNLDTFEVRRKVPESSVFYSDVADETGSHSWWESRIHPEDRAGVQERIQRLLQDGGSYWSAEYRFKRPDGTYACIFDQGFLILSEDGGAIIYFT